MSSIASFFCRVNGFLNYFQEDFCGREVRSAMRNDMHVSLIWPFEGKVGIDQTIRVQFHCKQDIALHNLWKRGDRREGRWQHTDRMTKENGAWSRPEVLPVDRWRRPVDRPGRPACTGVYRKERSTGPSRPTEVALLSGRRGRPSRSTVAWVCRPAGRLTGAAELSFQDSNSFSGWD